MADFKTFQDIIKRENWKGKYVYVARDPRTKQFLSRINVKGNKVTKQILIDRYKNNNILREGIKVEKVTLTNVKETSIFYENPKKVKPIQKQRRQYIVKGDYKGETIFASSQVYGSVLAQTNAEMVRRARESFWEKVGFIAGDGYREDQGKLFEDEIKNYSEGWKYYEKL